MYDQTGHEIPTLEQRLGTTIILDMDRGEVMRVEPIHQLIDPIISYLPPARKSYDEFTITIMKPSLVIKKKRFSFMLFDIQAWEGDRLYQSVLNLRYKGTFWL